jgi:hypothetical protein
MLVQQEAFPCDDAGFRSILVDDIGDPPEQRLYRGPDFRIYAGVKVSKLFS